MLPAGNSKIPLSPVLQTLKTVAILYVPTISLRIACLRPDPERTLYSFCLKSVSMTYIVQGQNLALMDFYFIFKSMAGSWFNFTQHTYMDSFAIQTFTLHHNHHT